MQHQYYDLCVFIFFNFLFRNNQCQTETVSSKFVRNTDINEKSPVTADARLRRRQSLTNLETLGLSASRRSSLGGKSVDSGE